MIRWLALLSLGLALWGAPRVARADDAAMRAARRHFERGEKLFALGKFDDALEEYQEAFDAKPIPDFLFNIGQCYRNLGDYDQAIFSFKKYLRLEPDAPNKDAVDKLIADLEEKQERGEGQRFIRKAPPPRVTATTTSTPVYKRWWFWTAVGAVAIGGSVGIYEGTKGGPPGTDLGNIVFGK